MKNATLFLPSLKIWKPFVHRESQRQNGAETFWQFARVKCHIPNWSETSASVSWIFEFGGNLFSSSCGMLLYVTCTTDYLSIISDHDLIYSSADLQFCWHKSYISSALALPKLIFRQMLKNCSILWHRPKLYFATWLMKRSWFCLAYNARWG